ncbi:MAG: hypothetical protein WD992_01545 [Candidatus Levyibacteriota bacterium]
MSREALILSPQQSNYLARLSACVEIVSVIRGVREEGKEVVFKDGNKTVFPPIPFRQNGGTDQIIRMIDRAIVGMIYELAYPLDGNGISTADEDMRRSVHMAIESGKRTEIDK